MAKRSTPIGGSDNDDGNDNEGRMSRRLDPLVRALLGHLPPSHSVWPPQERQKWITMLQEAFGVIYKDAEQVKPAGAPIGTGTQATQHPSGPVPPTR
jgi:hypothetical protein